MGWRVPDRPRNWEPKNIEGIDCLHVTNYGKEHFLSLLDRVNEGVEFDIDYFHEHLDKNLNNIIKKDDINIDQETRQDFGMLIRTIKHAEHAVNDGYDCCQEYYNTLNPTLWILLAGEEYYSSIKRLYDLYTDIGQYLIYKLPLFGSDESEDLINLGDIAAEINLSGCQKFMEREEITQFKAWLRQTNAQFNDATVNGR